MGQGGCCSSTTWPEGGEGDPWPPSKERPATEGGPELSTQMAGARRKEKQSELKCSEVLGVLGAASKGVLTCAAAGCVGHRRRWSGTARRARLVCQL